MTSHKSRGHIASMIYGNSRFLKTWFPKLPVDDIQYQNDFERHKPSGKCVRNIREIVADTEGSNFDLSVISMYLQHKLLIGLLPPFIR